MEIQEFVDKNCSKCINKDRIKDDCEIRKNIAGEYQCVNMKLVETDGNNFKFEEIKEEK